MDDKKIKREVGVKEPEIFGSETCWWQMVEGMTIDEKRWWRRLDAPNSPLSGDVQRIEEENDKVVGRRKNGMNVWENWKQCFSK